MYTRDMYAPVKKISPPIDGEEEGEGEEEEDEEGEEEEGEEAVRSSLCSGV